jgi:tetratricopeptide (TPR) repeat protein
MNKRHPRRVLAVLSVAAAIVTSNGEARADEFSDARLRSGEDATVARRYVDAISELKIAAFGSLDRPPVLSETLVWLTLAQTAAGRPTDVQATIDRFLEVERRFGAYPKARLEPDTRSAFQAILLKQVPQGTIQSIPSLANLIETQEQKFARLPAADRRRALEASAKSEPTQAKWPAALAREAMERGDAKDAARWADQALKLEPANAEALAARGRARVATKDYPGAVRDFAALPPAELARRPELAPDRFVALVETGDWSGAEQVLTAISVPAASRADVARAQQKLATEKQRRNAAPASPAPAAQGSPAAGSTPAPAAASAPTSGAGSPPAAASGKTVASGPESSAARSRETLAESRRLITSGKSAEAVRLLNDALRADPGNRELRLTLLEAGCLSRSYSVAAAQLPLVTPFSDAEAAPMFYAAVVLYETGRDNEAKSYFEKAAPRVSGPLVEEYSRKILGRP